MCAAACTAAAWPPAWTTPCLSYSAQEGGQRDIAHHLAPATHSFPGVLHAGAVPMLKPTAGCGSAGLDQGGSSSSSSNSGGCGEEGHQLGLVHTLSKRAAVLGRALGAARATGLQGPGPELGLGTWAGDQQLLPFLYEESVSVLLALCDAMDSVQGDVGRVYGGAVQREGTTVGAIRGEQRGGGTAPGPEAACVEQARDTLALASRAASHLATSLAWGLAVDVAEGSVTAE